MGVKTLLLLFVAGVSPAHAQSYGLRNLHPLGLSQQVSGSERKQLFQFRNELGDHFVLYEESPGAGSVREISSLVTFMNNGDRVCSIDLDCHAKAFCAGDCKKFYYEVFNVAAPQGRNSCVIKAFSCSQPGAGP